MVHEDRFVLIIEIDIQICDPSLLQNVKSKRLEISKFLRRNPNLVGEGGILGSSDLRSSP